MVSLLCDVNAIRDVRTGISNDTPFLEVVTATTDNHPHLWFMFATDGCRCLLVFLRSPDLRDAAMERLDEVERQGLARKFVCPDRRITRWLRLAGEKRGFKLRVFFKGGMMPFLHYYELRFIPPMESWMTLDESDADFLKRIADLIEEKAKTTESEV